MISLADNEGIDVVLETVGDDLFEPQCAASVDMVAPRYRLWPDPRLAINYGIITCFSAVGDVSAYGMSASNDPAMNEESVAQLFDWCDQGKLTPHTGKQVVCAGLPDALADLGADNALGHTIIPF